MQQREDRTLVENSVIQLSRTHGNTKQEEYKLINISRGGLCFQSKEDYELNETVSIDVIINQKTIHSANGRVCYRNIIEQPSRIHYGVSFLDKFINTEIIRNHSHS